jgi:hypothetical protein
LHNLKHNRVLHERNIILTIKTEDVPRVQRHERIGLEGESEEGGIQREHGGAAGQRLLHGGDGEHRIAGPGILEEIGPADVHGPHGNSLRRRIDDRQPAPARQPKRIADQLVENAAQTAGRFEARIEGPVAGNVLLRRAQYRISETAPDES